MIAYLIAPCCAGYDGVLDREANVIHPFDWWSSLHKIGWEAGHPGDWDPPRISTEGARVHREPSGLLVYGESLVEQGGEGKLLCRAHG
ncbi:MAG: hypothetical protein ACOC0P_00495 [Planctomycetota bacterium]